MKRLRKVRVNLLSGRIAALVLLGALFLIGSIAGCVAAGFLAVEQGAVLPDLVREYTSVLEQKGAVGRFLPVLWQVVRVPFAAFLLGLTAFGVVGLPALFAVRGFCLCYAVSAFYRLLGTSGLLLGVCLFGVSAALWMPALFELGVTGLTGAYGLMRRVRGDGRYPLPAAGGPYWLRCGLCAGMVILCAGAEYLLVPALVRLVLPLI